MCMCEDCECEPPRLEPPAPPACDTCGRTEGKLARCTNVTLCRSCAEMFITAIDEEQDMGELHVLIAGDLINGFRVIGPFYSYDDAAAYAEAHERHNQWTAVAVDKAEY